MAQDNTGQTAPRIPVRDFRGGDYFRVHNALVDHYGPSLESPGALSSGVSWR